MHLAYKWHHMMLAETENFYVFDDDKLVMVFVKDSTVNKVSHILFVAFCEVHKSFRISFRRFSQAFSFWVFADALEDRADSVSEFVESNLGFLRRLIESFSSSESCQR